MGVSINNQVSQVIFVMNLICNMNQSISCAHTSEIAAYLDGELDARCESAFEEHLNQCSICSEKLNEQKRLLWTLDSVLSQEKSFELPAEFVKNIVIKAESNVSGLRAGRERQNAFFIVTALVLCCISLSVGEGKNELLSFGAADQALGKFAVVAQLVINFCYDFGVGAIVILRAVSRQMLFDASLIAVFLVVFVASLVALSRVLFEGNRVKS